MSCGGQSEAEAASSGGAKADTAKPPGGGGGRPGAGGRGDHGGRGGRPGGFPGFGGFGEASSTAIPVDTATVIRSEIADYLETNGTLEAENEVDIVARIGGPIVELLTEEGRSVQGGELLARIDADEVHAQLGIAKVNLEEARVTLRRAQISWENELIPQEAFDQARATYDSAAAQIKGTEILLGYTEIRAPFDGLIIERVIKFAEFVNPSSRLFRISDFDPLLCEIRVPEKDLSRIRVGQPGYLTVESFPEQRFRSTVLRVNPVIDAATGTVKVTLSVSGKNRLRPGMFASVYVEIDVHQEAIVVPRSALVLESIGDSLYVVEGEVARRREVQVGFTTADTVEILAGVEPGEKVVMVGQDALSDGTPVYILNERTPPGMTPAAGGAGTTVAAASPPHAGAGVLGRSRASSANAGQNAGHAGRPGPPGAQAGGGRPGGGRGGFRDIDWDDPEQVERVKGFMKQRGLSDEQIEKRIEQMRAGNFSPGRGNPSASGRPPGGSEV